MTKKTENDGVRLAVSAVFLIAGALMEGKTAYAWIPFGDFICRPDMTFRPRRCATFPMARYLMRIS